MLTQADGHFPAGPTIWQAEGTATPASSLNLPSVRWMAADSAVLPTSPPDGRPDIQAGPCS